MNALSGLSDLEVLGLTIIGEARGEPVEGQVAVGCVVRNRLHNNPSKYKSFAQVCYEPKQFSCWNSTDSNFQFLYEIAEKMIMGTSPRDPYMRQCFWVAAGVVDWSLIDNSQGSLFYMTRELFYSDKRPSWARLRTPPVVYGKQIFFDILKNDKVTREA